MSNSGSVVVVTGAAGGLGKALVAKLLTEGAKVAMTDIDQGRLDAALGEVGGGEVFAQAGDLTRFTDLESVVQNAVKRWGKLDHIVHTAGGDMRVWANVLEYSHEDWQRCVDLNLTGSFNVVKAAGRAMKDTGGGHILMVSSGTSLRPTTANIGYAASKAGMLGLMRGAAMDLAPYNIRVNIILPGLTLHKGVHLKENEQGELVPLDDAYEAAINKYKQNTALNGELSTPGDFASYASFLLTTRAISSQIINFDSKIFF